MKHLLLAIALMLCNGIKAQVETMPMKHGRTPEGAVYFLPKTAIRLNLLIEKRTYTPGNLAKYAEKYLRISGIEQKEDVVHSIVGITLTTVGVRDTSTCYAVKLKGGKCETAELHLSEDGVLLSVNAEPIKQEQHYPFQPAPKTASPDPRQFFNADVLAAGSTSKMAELIVQQMLELQEQRQQLITGESDNAPQDEHQLRLMLDEIDRQREALMSLFTGTVTRDTVEHVIEICPDREMKREPLFRLSRKFGLVDKDDLAGVPYYISIEDLHHTTEQKYSVPENKKADGFYANVPGRINLTLQSEDRSLGTFTLSVAQFGFVELRSGSIFKRYVTHMTLNPATGAVVSLHADQPE